MFLPQPPPPPILDAPRRRSAWADFPIGLEDDDPAVTMKDIVDKSDCATQCDLAFTAERPSFTAAQAVPPLSGDFLDTIDRAL